MALTPDEKAILARVYEPILYYHPSEPYRPHGPGFYMRSSALWCNRPVAQSKRSWGSCSHATDDPFPREPLIASGSLSVDPDVEGRTYIGTPDESGFQTYLISNEERELFLERQSYGWSQGGPNTDDARSAENAASASPAGTNLPTYFVDVRDQDSIGNIPKDSDTPLPPGFADALQALYPSGFWLLTFHLFYVYHEERLTDCEIDSEVVRERRSGEPRAESLHGSYAGDWQAVSVLVPNPGVMDDSGSTGLPPQPASPSDLPDDQFPPPDHVGFSRRARGVLVNVSSNVVESRSFTFMPVASVSAGEVALSGRHVKVFVAQSTHNNYATEGDHAAPKSDSTLPFPVEIVDTCLLADELADLFVEIEEVRDEIDRAKEEAKTVGVGIGKIAGGAAAGAIAGAFGGPLGAAIGAVVGLFAGGMAAVAEGLGGDGPTPLPPYSPTGPETVPDPGPGPGAGPGSVEYGVVLAPEELLDELTDELEGRAEQVRGYGGEIPDRIIDRGNPSQIWWQPDGAHAIGYQGKWGVICERDPFDRRSGTAIPSFEALFVNAVLTETG